LTPFFLEFVVPFNAIGVNKAY